MKKFAAALPLLCGVAFISFSAQAQSASGTTDFDRSIAKIAAEWDQIKYQTPDKGVQIKDLQKLEVEAHDLGSAYPTRPEPNIWEGIALSTEAGLTGGMSALPDVKSAKALFESAIAIDGNAMNGGAHTSLGSLYYLVPGWPIAFGNDKKAGEELKTALSIAPDDIDANYFYGDYLIEQKKYGAAIPVLEKALQAAARPGRAVGDAGRRQEIQQDLAKAQGMEARSND